MSYLSTNGTAVAPQLGTCDVCRLLDNDTRPKLVSFCSACGAWMCAACRGNWIRRALAMAKRARGA